MGHGCEWLGADDRKTQSDKLQPDGLNVYNMQIMFLVDKSNCRREEGKTEGSVNANISL